MEWIDSDMERRGEERIRRRIDCLVLVGDEVHAGSVLEMSARGLLVRSDATPPCGAKARIRLLDANGGTFAELEGSVAHKREVPHRLADLASGTLGLTLSYAPEAYLHLCEHPRGGSSPPTSASAPADSDLT